MLEFLRRWRISGPDRTVARRILVEYGLPRWRAYLMALVFGVAAALCTSAIAYLIGHGIDRISAMRSPSAIVAACTTIVVAFALRGACSYGQAMIIAREANRIAAISQQKVFDKLLTQSLSYLDNWHSSAFVNRMSYASAAPGLLVNYLVNSLAGDLVTLVGLLTVMVLQVPLLSLISIAVMVPTALCLQYLSTQVRLAVAASYQSTTATAETVQETLQGIKVVKTFNLEPGMRARMAASVAAGRGASDRLAKLNNQLGPIMDAVGGVVVALMFGYGAYQVVSSDAAPGQFISFITAFLLAYEPIKRLARLNFTLKKHIHDAGLLFDVLDSEEGEATDNGGGLPAGKSGDLEFDKVTFAYPGRPPLLDHTSFSARRGELTALVGASGSGKTTILNLVLRLYEPDAGRIVFGGQDIAAVARVAVRRQIAYVGQDVFLFNGTIAENIAAGKPGSSREDIVEAARSAFAHDFIAKLPAGYDTAVGEFGARLSAGQRQRIAIARAILKDANLILLDEPTSALDSESERIVVMALDRLCKGKTALLVAHRLHTVVGADCIHVVHEGQVVESGTHGALAALNGRYAAMLKMQSAEAYAAPAPAVAD